MKAFTFVELITIIDEKASLGKGKNRITQPHSSTNMLQRSILDQN